MSRKILYLINPVSGTGNKSALKKTIQEKTAAAGIPFEIRDTVADGNYDDIRRSVKDSGITDILICGGDGTINKVINALRDLNVTFGIIPMGSGNGLALGANIPENTPKAIELILQQGRPVATDAFLINGKFSCMLSGLGFDAVVAHDFAGRKVRGFLTYFRRTLFHFFSCRPYHFEIIVNGKSLSTEAFFISIANSNQFGNHFTIAPAASMNDGLLDFVVVNKMNKFSLVVKTLRQIRAGKISAADAPGKDKGVHYFNAAKLQIKNPELAPLHIDGDPEETAESINIEIIPGAFRLIRP